MIFERSDKIENLGEKLGYIFSYFLFTTVLYVVLTLLKKIPENWTYFNIMIITITIALIGILFKKLLK